MTLDLWYEVVENGRIVERYFESSQVYLHKVQEIRDLLNETGFKILEEYGNHQLKKYENLLADAERSARNQFAS